MQLSPGMFSRMASILDSTRGTGAERRREPRMPVHGTGRLAPPGTPVDQATMVHVQDVSLGGASLLASERLSVGEQLVLVLQAPDGRAMSLLCAVAHCRQMADDIYQIGAQFLHAQGTDGAQQSGRLVATVQPAGELISPLAEAGGQRFRHLFNDLPVDEIR